MGLSFHYRGAIDPARIHALVEEVKAVALIYGWGYHVFVNGHIAESAELHESGDNFDETVDDSEETVRGVETQLDADEGAEVAEENAAPGFQIKETLPLNGILVNPGQGCEGLSLLFDPQNRLTSLISYMLTRDGTFSEDMDWVSTKTQFAPVEVHATLIELLRFLEKNYLQRLEVTDEGGYWDTGDAKVLRQRHERLGNIITNFTEALRQTQIPEDVDRDDPDAVADAIEDLVKKIWEREKLQEDDENNGESRP